MNSKMKRDIAEQMVAGLEAGAPITESAAQWLKDAVAADGTWDLYTRTRNALIKAGVSVD